MKKAYLVALLWMLCTISYAQFPTPYCGPITFLANVEPITLVNFAGFNKTSSNTVGTTAHENFTSTIGQVTAGQTYPITLKGNTDGDFITALSVFIDWNRDNDFYDANETYYIGTITNSTGLDSVKLEGNINVPGYISAGNVRMRVLKIWNDGDLNVLPEPCNANLADFGQAEDYTLNVTAITQCLTGTKFPANAFAASNCDGSIATISTASQTNQYIELITVANSSYRVLSSRSGDYLTLTEDAGATVLVAGYSEISFTATVSDTVRVYIHADINCATDTLTRSIRFACGLKCFNGNLFPSSTFTPNVCDSVTQNLITDSASSGQYSNVEVRTASDYIFSTSNPNDYITLTADGINVSAEGPSPLEWKSNLTGTIRFYVNTDRYCSVDTLKRSKYVVCSILEPPGCVSNMYPPDGDTLYVSVENYLFSWDLPSTGGPILQMTMVIGTDSLNPQYFFPVPIGNNIPIILDQTDLNKTYYWWLELENEAGISTCRPIIHSFKVLQSPATSVNNTKELKASIYPNPAYNQINIINAEDIQSALFINTLGQLVKSIDVDQKDMTVDVSDLKAGIYQLLLRSKQGTEKVIKFVKE